MKNEEKVKKLLKAIENSARHEAQNGDHDKPVDAEIYVAEDCDVQDALIDLIKDEVNEQFEEEAEESGLSYRDEIRETNQAIDQAERAAFMRKHG